MTGSDTFERQYQLVFFSVLVLLLMLERVHALQREPVRIARRWTSNVGLFLIGSVLSALVIPVGLYAFAQDQPPGLLTGLDLPFTVQLVVTFLLLDFLRYWEHRLFHLAPLWRLHLVHHSDTHVDVTTTERHHPLELLLATALVLAAIALLRLPAEGVGLYLLVAAAVALYSHANLRLPVWLERSLNRVIVTPAVHAVHHSVLPAQTNSNYGTVLTIWDRLFDSYLDPLATPITRLGLEYFHQPGDTGLTRVLQQPFLYRRDLAVAARGTVAEADPPQATPAAAAGATIPPVWKAALATAGAGSLLVLLVLWPTVLELMASWRNNEAYQYAWLVAPMVAYLLGWQHRQRTLSVHPRPGYAGVGVALFAALCWSGAHLANLAVGRQFALVLALQGVAMAALGWRAYWKLFPTLALLFLMVPGADLLEPALRLVTLKAIELFAVLAQLPHNVDGFVIHVAERRYIVVDDCSGLSYVTLAMFLGYCFGLLMYRSMHKVVALSVLGGMLGIFSNALRVNAIVLVDWLRGSQMDLAAHGNIQWIALFVTLALLFFVLSWLKPDALPDAAPIDQGQPGHWSRRFAPLLAGLCVLLVAAAAVGLPDDHPRAPRAAQAGVWPGSMAGWVMDARPAAWSVDPHGSTESIRLRYRRLERELHVVLAETLAPGAKLPESLLVPADGNVWRQKQVGHEVSCIASRCITLVHAVWQRDKSQQLRHVYHVYGIGGLTTESRLVLRLAHGWQRLTGGDASPRLTALVSDAAVPADELAAVLLAFRAAFEG